MFVITCFILCSSYVLRYVIDFTQMAKRGRKRLSASSRKKLKGKSANLNDAIDDSMQERIKGGNNNNNEVEEELVRKNVVLLQTLSFPLMLDALSIIK